MASVRRARALPSRGSTGRHWTGVGPEGCAGAIVMGSTARFPGVEGACRGLQQDVHPTVAWSGPPRQPQSEPTRQDEERSRVWAGFSLKTWRYSAAKRPGLKKPNRAAASPTWD